MTRALPVYLALCFTVCLAQQGNNQASTNAEVVSPTRKDEFGILLLPNGSKFVTNLFELKLIGQLSTEHKLPYYILAGRACQDCDANTSIYIHSPSDGPLKDEGSQRRFLYPGKNSDNETGKPVSRVRMFFGDCSAAFPNAAIWFQKWKNNNGKWTNGIVIAHIKSDALLIEAPPDVAPKLKEVEVAVRKGSCHELPGIDGYTEP